MLTMNNRCVLMRYLLDKNIVRYALSALKYGQQRPLSPLEFHSLAHWKRAEEQGVVLYIGVTTHHVLEQMRDNPGVNLLLRSMLTLYPTQYHRRWSRRVRTMTGLSREDAYMIGLATFGTDTEGKILGVDSFVTYDQPLHNGFAQHRAGLQARLEAMTTQLTHPFINAKLPKLMLPMEMDR